MKQSKEFIDKCKDILNHWVWGDDAEEMIDQLRSLNTEGEITDEEYDYILDNWDDLLEEE